MPYQPKRFAVSSFTNVAGERVHQAMCGGLPITRELADLERATNAAREAFAQHNGRAVLLSWDGDTDEERELEAKAA